MPLLLSQCRLFIGLFLLSCCHSVTHTHQPTAHTEVEQDPKMIFLTFAIESDSNKESRITMISKKITAGTLKASAEKIITSNHLTISLLNRNRQVLETESIEHPLFKEVEYTQDNGEFTRKTLNLKQAEFFIRIKHPPGAKWVIVDEIINEKRVNSVEFNIVE